MGCPGLYLDMNLAVSPVAVITSMALASMSLASSTMGWAMASIMVRVPGLCSGRLVFTLEGGYHLEALAYAVLNTVRVLLGDLASDGGALADPLGPYRGRETDIAPLLVQLKGLHRLV